MSGRTRLSEEMDSILQANQLDWSLLRKHSVKLVPSFMPVLDEYLSALN